MKVSTVPLSAQWPDSLETNRCTMSEDTSKSLHCKCFDLRVFSNLVISLLFLYRRASY